MITAVDTNVLLDVFIDDPEFAEVSSKALRDSIGRGRVIACDVVFAEVAAFFSDPAAARAAMDAIGIDFDPITAPAALAGGAAWSDYRRRGGRRRRIIADFLIGAHAGAHAGRLLTRDRGFYRSYFGQLELYDPAAAPQ